jgi:hypothetical protein
MVFRLPSAHSPSCFTENRMLVVTSIPSIWVRSVPMAKLSGMIAQVIAEVGVLARVHSPRRRN